MPPVGWSATIVDSPGSEPYAVVGDLVVAVRTPRSRDFVTVEVAPASRCDPELFRRPEVYLSSKPYPCLTDQWQGEVRIGDTVGVQLAGESYRVTLTRLSDCATGQPWITCDFWIERD